jgi:hypothetical protein
LCSHFVCLSIHFDLLLIFLMFLICLFAIILHLFIY